MENCKVYPAIPELKETQSTVLGSICFRRRAGGRKSFPPATATQIKISFRRESLKRKPNGEKASKHEDEGEVSKIARSWFRSSTNLEISNLNNNKNNEFTVKLPDS